MEYAWRITSLCGVYAAVHNGSGSGFAAEVPISEAVDRGENKRARTPDFLREPAGF